MRLCPLRRRSAVAASRMTARNTLRPRCATLGVRRERSRSADSAELICTETTASALQAAAERAPGTADGEAICRPCRIFPRGRRRYRRRAAIAARGPQPMVARATGAPPVVEPGSTRFSRRSRKRERIGPRQALLPAERQSARRELRRCELRQRCRLTQPTAPADGAPSSPWRARRRGRCGRAWPRPRDGRSAAATAAGRPA